MAPKLKGLGRGLDALLMPETALRDPSSAGVRTLPLSELVPGRFQPRRHFDEASLSELAESIRAQGLMQPIVVRKLGEGRYEIIAGERRFRAAERAGLQEVPVLVREVDDATALTLALIENLQRKDLNPIEEAEGLARLIREFGFTHEQAGAAVGKSRSAVSNLLRLLELAPAVRERVLEGKLEAGAARALATLPRDRQVLLAERIALQGLSVRAVEALVKSESAAAAQREASRGTDRSRPSARDPDLVRIETELADLLGAAVTIRQGRGGRGELVIRYANLEQFDGLLVRLRGASG
ncbi:MAG: ParB/RepB/Spo0J family partition protein [Casimicrobiaceae bacterium]|nr:ParB/RepB/Spo0J family partition protein [Casimicrobiaceae bacterium]MCX8099002.1 ParB/RepB/Spo0J family partition protein [Casimicrobiaceae bacterium]MDW8311470.1 ParB/RepB/Spo0J family partition protein [Burkholderiales bacterium]